MDKAKKEQTKKGEGLKGRMENFYFELTDPDGKVTKIGDKPSSKPRGG